MYIPIMKNREQELRVIQDMNKYFSNNIIPLIEIIKDEHEIRYAKDSNGDYKYEMKPGRKRKTKITLPKRDRDIITLSSLQKRLKNKKAFIDFFRFKDKEYGNKKYKDIELSFSLSRDYNSYRNRLLEVSKYNNFIPTISIKEGFNPSMTDLHSLILELKRSNPSIAIRITDDFLDTDDYLNLIEKHLSENDFIMLDIREQSPEVKFIELEEFKEFETEAKKILLNSPRLRKYKNSDYKNLVFTNKIDNSATLKYKEYNLEGVGDFGGLKDDLPSEGGGGYGSALALMFSKDKNQFFSIVNKNSKLGLRGYPYVVGELLKKFSTLDESKDCPVIKKIKENAQKNSFGNWQSWTYYTLARYIHQQATK